MKAHKPRSFSSSSPPFQRSKNPKNQRKNRHLRQSFTRWEPEILWPKVVVKTGDGTIDAEQKAELLRLKNEWLLAHNAVKAKPLSHQAAFSRLNAAMKVSGYAELKPEQFEKARAWLLQQTAKVRAMPSAARKEGDRWRNARYKAIKARCKNQLGDEFAYRPYIKRYFNADSLTELGDQDLERTYRYVMGKRAQMGSGSAQA